MESKPVNMADFLFKSSTKMLIDNPDDFLSNFSLNYFEKKNIIKAFSEELNKPGNKRIGEASALGEAFQVGSWVIKRTNVCPDDVNSRFSFTRLICQQAKLGDIIYRIPNSYTKKHTLFAPGYITESLIGILLSNEKHQKYTPSFSKVIGFQYDKSSKNKSVYTMMEHLEDAKSKLNNPTIILYTLFQIAQCLDVGQKLHRFTHYDLHSGNFLMREKDHNILRVYALNNGKYLYALTWYDAVLIDYGMSRLETNKTIISSRATLPVAENLSIEYPDFFNWYEFDPFYDLFSILYHLLFLTEGITGINEDLKIRLMADFFKIQPSSRDFKRDVEKILTRVLVHKDYWRANPNKLCEYNVSCPCYPDEFMIKLSEIFESKQRSMSVNFKNEGDIVDFLNENGVCVLDKIINLSNVKNVKKMLIHQVAPELMDTVFYPTSFADSNAGKMKYIEITSRLGSAIPSIREEFRNYTKTPSEKSRKRGNLSNQYIHIANINQEDGIKNGYKFMFDCCRIDVRNFLRNKNIKSGIAINASFFNINDNFFPIGYYKTKDISSNNPPPDLYKNLYGLVTVDKKGYLHIINNYSEKEVATYEQVLSSGPILVWNSEIIMTSSKMNEVSDYILKFQCRKPKENENPGDKYLDSGLPKIAIPNCKGNPGELNHAGNPNPRTAIAIDNINRVYFIYVEGRDKRGDGMDLNQLAQLCLHIGAVKAINLDGGESSQMVWRNPKEEIIYQTNPDHDFAYPVGNIISFVKMTSNKSMNIINQQNW